jgi:hypothetical protein
LISECCLPLLTEFLSSFAYGLVAAVIEVCKIFWSDSEVTSINMGICFEYLAIAA